MVTHLLFDSRSQKSRLGRCDRAQHLRRLSSAWEQAELRHRERAAADARARDRDGDEPNETVSNTSL